MMKRRPFGSHDPNVQQRWNGDDESSVASSVPSVEQALRLRRRKKKKKTAAVDGNNGFLMSTSKTPRISNRTKQLPPRRAGGGATKQLRRLEQSMASRAKQQQERTSFSDVSTNTTTNRRVESSAGTKRKERHADRADDALQKAKKVKQPVATDQEANTFDGIEKNPAIDKPLNENVSLRSKDSRTKSSVRGNKTNDNEHQHVGLKRRAGNRSVAIESPFLIKHHGSYDKDSKSSDALAKDQSSLQGSERSESPMALERNVSSTQVSQDIVEKDTTMDCTSDDESLHLSPPSESVSPVREKVVKDKAWALRLSVGGRSHRPPRHHDSTSMSDESEELERDNVLPRLSMTTHAEYGDPLESSPNLSNESQGELPETMEDLLRRENRGGPIVTKGMLSRARDSKADNEQVVDAMMNSGPPYRGRQERSPTPDGSMIGTMIGVNLHERSDSVDGSEVTMLTTDSYLNGFAEGHTTNLHPLGRSNDELKSGQRPEKDKKERGRMTSPDDVSAVPEVATTHRSHEESVREPQDEGNQVVYFEHNGTLIPHPALPSGWIIKVSKTKQRLFYCHPDHGTSWHCPIVVPQQFSSDPRFSALQQQPTTRTVNVPTQQKGAALEGDDDTESEDSELWSRKREQRNKKGVIGVDVESEVERHSHASSRCGRSASTAHSVAKEGTPMDVTEDYGSDISSLASSVVEKGKRANAGKDDGVEQRVSSLMEEDHVAVLQLRKDTPASSELTPEGQDVSKLSKNLGSASRSSASSRSDSSQHQVARVSLIVTEAATTEEVSSTVVEELVSTTNFGREEGETAPAVATESLQGVEKGSIDDELLEADDFSHKSVESTKSLEEGEGKDEALAETSCEKAPLLDKNDEETGHVADVEGGDERDERDGIPEPSSANSKTKRGLEELFSTPDTEIELPAAVQQTEQTVELIASHHKALRANTFNQVALLRENLPGGFEAEVDDAVFGGDHNIDLSPQATRLSPTKPLNSFDNGDKKAVGSDDETVLETPVEDTSPLPPPPTHDSPMALLDDSFEDDDIDPPVDKAAEMSGKEPDTMDSLANLSSPSEKNSPIVHSDIEGDDEYAASHIKDQQNDDQLSVESSPLTRKWRGYSHRIRHPPHPICALINIEALIERALRREERRKKAKKKRAHGKSSRRERRKTSTKLVFE